MGKANKGQKNTEVAPKKDPAPKIKYEPPKIQKFEKLEKLILSGE